MRPRLAAVILSVLGAGLLSASVAWACSPTNWGWTPPTPPASGQGPSSNQPPPPPGQASQAATSAQSSQAAPPSVSRTSGLTKSQQPAQAPPAQAPSRQSAQTPSRRSTSAPANAQGNAQGGVSTQGPARARSFAGEPRSQAAASGVSAGHASSPARAGGARNGHAPSASRGASAQAQGGTGDLWSAYSSHKSSSLTPSVSEAATPAAGPGSQLGVGMALLGLGAVGLFGGVAFAAARRRRALARSSSRS